MIKAVFIDAIKTIFGPYPSEVGLFKKVIMDVTGKNLSEEEVSQILVEAMAKTEKLDVIKVDSIQQWEYYPTKIAELVGCEGYECKLIGDRLRFETWGNPSNYRLYDDVLPLLKELKKREVVIACVSNEDKWLKNFFVHFGIEEYFDFVLTSSEIGIEKPNPKIFHNALSRTHFNPDEVLFVGDSLTCDYRASESVGMKPLLIDRENKNKDNSVVTIINLENILEFI
jgi:putative hydrolase of the HAD superfamily